MKKILLLGPPASGKGTQANRLSEKLSLPILGTGNLLRQAVVDNTELGIEAGKFISEGKYVPDKLIESLVLEWTEKHKEGWIFDGFPRTLEQAEFMFSHKDIGRPDLVIGLNVSKEELVKRVDSRRQCTDCTLVTSTYIHTEEACPKDACNGSLYARNDDAIESFLVRHSQYINLTKPLFEYFDKEELIQTVDGERTPDEVWEEVQKILS